MLVEASEFSVRCGRSEVVFTGATHRLPPTRIESQSTKEGFQPDRIAVDLGLLARCSRFSLTVPGGVKGKIELLGPDLESFPKPGEGALDVCVSGFIYGLSVTDRSFGIGNRTINVRGKLDRAVRVEIKGKRCDRDLKIDISYPRESGVEVTPANGVETTVEVSIEEIRVTIFMKDIQPTRSSGKH